MPDAWPTLSPLTTALAPWSPAAVLAVCEPWLLRSRGERYSSGTEALRPPASYQRAPITLLLQVIRCATSGSEPGSQTPCHFAAIVAASGRGDGSGAKLGLSGQKPVSRSATITPSPACFTLPNCFCHTPLAPSRPRNAGVETVSALNVSFFHTCRTPHVCARRVASDADSFRATPFNTTS
jgi:hypothetical protein